MSKDFGSMTRQMIMVGFLQAQNCTNYPFSWRHPDSRSDFLSPTYYREIARVLEAGKFHLSFFDDRLAMPDRHGDDHVHAVENGIRCVKMDPIPVLMAMAMATTRMGVGSTYSTTYYQPFHIARLFMTLDHMTDGRAAWNVVTSLNDGEAMNMGRDQVVAHDRRYDMADELMAVVHGHWDAWDDDALIVDKASGRFADGTKVHRLDHVGPFYRSRGPFTVPRSAQGHPVLIQAGASARGRRFAGRWGEIIFVTGTNVGSTKAEYATLKEAAARANRDPDKMLICTSIVTVAAATKAEAEDKMAAVRTLPKQIDQLSLLAEALNFDFSGKDLDAPLSDEEIASFSGLLAIRDGVLRASGKSNPTTRDFLTYNTRGTAEGAFVGGPKEIADRLEELFVERACDGFVVGATHVPGGYDDFVKHVVPELQRRGLYHRDYAGATLRDNLGLPRPAIGAWKERPAGRFGS